MRHLTWILAVAHAPLLSLAYAQEGRRAAEPPPGELGPVLSRQIVQANYPGAPLPAPDSKNEILSIGQGLRAELDDGVPLPVRANVTPGATGDTVVSEASGDPYFLSFAAAALYPPADQRVDPALVQAASKALAAGRSSTFAFVMFSKRMTPARIAVLESMGIQALSFHPHYCLKVAVPVASIDACASLDFVRWIGVPTPQQKLHPVLAEQLGTNPTVESIDVWIDVFESDLTAASRRESVGSAQLWDASSAGASLPSAAVRVQSGGWQEQALVQMGVEVFEYVDSIRAFRARIAPSLLENLVSADFVQFLEPNIAPSLAHDESRPMVSNDIVQGWYNGAASQAVTIGHVDSGVDLAHQDLGNFAGVGWDLGGGYPFNDGCEHGTHVIGTILGRGNVTSSLKGNAPGLATWGGTSRAFLARIFDDACSASNISLATIASVMNTDFFDGFSTSPKPAAINNSWGTWWTGSPWIGSEANPRILDSEVYWGGQAWIFASGNEGYGQKIRQEASAKNVLTVGSVDDYVVNGYDPGGISASSSTGPCGDGRWKPNLVAPGSQIMSIDANSGNGYKELSGTSMATPHVTGLVAQLCDAIPWMRYRSCAIQSVLMASATTRNNALLTWPPTQSYEHMNTYGAGRIDGMRAILGTGDSWWNTWTFDQPGSNWNYADFNVPTGTTRIVVCMHYDEDASSAGAGQALVNDWDLYIDAPPVDPFNGNTGDYVVQQSYKDNTEIRILDYPTPGAWRWKVWPQSSPTGATVRMGMTVYFVTGSTTPAMSIATFTADSFVKPNEQTYIHSGVTNGSSFNASAVFIDSNDIFATVHQASYGLFDGSYANVTNNHQGGKDIMLGNIPFGFGRGVDWWVSWPWEGVWPWGTMARGDNFNTVADNSTYITVDGTPPSDPVPSCSTHAPWTWSTTSFGQFNWSTPPDNIAGVEGYAIQISFVAPGDPGTVMNLGAVNNWSAPFNSSASPSYLSMRAIDRCGNASAPVHLGPFFVDYTPPPAATNVGSALSPGYWVGGDGLSSFGGYWDTVVDFESGLAGYGVEFDQNPNTIPGVVNELPTATSIARLITVSGSYYLHVRAKDYAGNWSTTVHAGPYLYNVAPNSTYCTAKVNALGCTPSISAVNHGSVYYTSNFVVSCANVRNNKSGLLFYGVNGPAASPFQGGTLCIKAPIKRTPSVNSGGSPSGNDCSGVYQIDMNKFAHGTLGGTPIPELLQQGTTVRCQWWGRDPGFQAPNNTTLSNALEYFVCYF